MSNGPFAALNRALETGDATDFVALLAPGAVIWHNDDLTEVDAADLMHQAGELQSYVRDPRIEVTRCEQFPGGWVQQFVLCGTAASTGKPVRSHRCAVLHEVDAKVTRIDEYVDPTFFDQLA